MELYKRERPDSSAIRHREKTPCMSRLWVYAESMNLWII
jgi:hypothetical protein